MQTGIRKHAWLYVIVAVLIAVVLVSLYYQFGYLPQKQSGETFSQSSQGTIGSAGGPNIAGGPCIFATLSFSNATGFVTTVHPTSGTIEFVLLPNSVGEFTVTYAGINFNNLTMSIFNPVENPVPVLNVLSNGTLGTGSGLSVTESSLTWVTEHQVGQGLGVTESKVTWVSYYQVVVNYTVTSGGSDGLYVVGLPSTCLSTIVDVGTQPCTGPLTWLNGIIY
jgi:hypothetical protein